MTANIGDQALPRFRPLYVQIKELFVQRLATGDWRPGTMLPSEQALAAEYGVSQGTLRKALEELTADKLLVRHQGKGTKVAEHDPHSSLFQFFRIHAEDGERQIPNSRYIDCQRGAAHEAEAVSLHLRARSHVIRISRMRDFEGEPALTETVVLPAKLFPGLEKRFDDLPNTLYSMYQNRFGITVVRAQERLCAVAANTSDARQLNVEVGEPLLEISRVAQDIQGRPVEWRVSRCLTRGHHYLSQLT